MILWLLLQAVVPPAAPPPPPDPLGDLRSTVVAAIRNCGTGTEGEIVVCSPDHGFAEGERLTKLKKPKPVDTGNGIKLELSTPSPLGMPGPR